MECSLDQAAHGDRNIAVSNAIPLIPTRYGVHGDQVFVAAERM
jgi:hypothetical protein